MKLALGGYGLHFSCTGKGKLRGLRESPFYFDTVRKSASVHTKDAEFPAFEAPYLGSLQNSEVNIEVVFDYPEEKWTKGWMGTPLLVDSGATWGLRLTGDPEWPFQMGPSQKSGYDLRSLHLLASRDFRRAKIHYGIWRNRFTETFLFYPYEQAFMIHLLQFNQSLLVHASGIRIGKKGYLFLGDSGAGKSTIASLFEEKLGKGNIYSDDRIILRHQDQKWWMYGTPWHGTLDRVIPKGIELGGFFFLDKKPQHEIRRLSADESVRHLIPVCFATWWLPEYLGSYFETVSKIANQSEIPLFRLGFKPDVSVADFVMDRLHG